MTHPISLQNKKPALPAMRQLKEDEIDQLATLRGLSIEGIHLAIAHGRLGFCRWPQWQKRDGEWFFREGVDVHPSFVITDAHRRVASFRRLDGKPYEWRGSPEDEPRPIKSWTKGSPAWPLGLPVKRELSPRVLLVEGGPDFLAAHHFLTALWLDAKGRAMPWGGYDPVCMLAASCAIAPDALRFFERKRVRIMIHDDAPDKTSVRIPSYEAAARWTEQLTAAGAAVETFSLSGIGPMADGRMVKDLNDLARTAPEVWQSPEIRAAFFEWDF